MRDDVESGEGGGSGEVDVGVDVGVSTSAPTPSDDDFYDHPVPAHVAIEAAEPILEEKRHDTRADLFDKALAVYERVLSSSDPKTLNAQLGAARDVISETGPFAPQRGLPPPPNGREVPLAAISNLVSAMIELTNGTVIAVKDMRHEGRNDAEGGE